MNNLIELLESKKITKSEANRLWETAIFYNNELAYLVAPKTAPAALISSHAKQTEDFKYKASVLADYCNDIYGNPAAQKIIDATKSMCINLTKKY